MGSPYWRVEFRRKKCQFALSVCNKLMKIILIQSRHGKPVSLDFNSWAMVLVSLFVFGVPLGVGVAKGLAVSDEENSLVEALGTLEAELNAQKLLLAEGQQGATLQLTAYSSKLAGIVTPAESVEGYGDMEVDHGGGLIARYAHNSDNLVSIGELVKKEQIIERMGSTGRFRGSHVHFELYKHGRHIDPASYVWRTVR
jgi:hypothetical protein